MEAVGAFCGHCGRAMAAQDLVTLNGVAVCAACKPQFLRRLQEGAVSSGFTYRGFWIRFLAKLLDSLILDVVIWIVLLAAAGSWYLRTVRGMSAAAGDPMLLLQRELTLVAVFGAAGLLLVLGYSTWMNGRWGATVGKMAIGAVIVNTDGTPISYGKAFARACAELLSALILDIGYIIAAFDGQKRALHDHICGTLVIRREDRVAAARAGAGNLG